MSPKLLTSSEDCIDGEDRAGLLTLVTGAISASTSSVLESGRGDAAHSEQFAWQLDLLKQLLQRNREEVVHSDLYSNAVISAHELAAYQALMDPPLEARVSESVEAICRVAPLSRLPDTLQEAASEKVTDHIDSTDLGFR